MRLQVLGTVQAVTDREFTRRDGTQGVAHNVMLNVNGELLQGDIFTSGDNWQNMGCKAGAVGTMSIWMETRQKQTKDGHNYMSNEWRFMDFRLANAQAPAELSAQEVEHSNQF